MTIDNITDEVGWLTKYEAPKVSILRRLLDGMRAIQVVGDHKEMKKEMDVLLNMLRRIDAVIPGEIVRFKDNKKIISLLDSQRMIISDLNRYAEFYKSQADIGVLNSTYNKISEAIISFITLSKSMINVNSLKKAA